MPYKPSDIKTSTFTNMLPSSIGLILLVPGSTIMKD